MIPVRPEHVSANVAINYINDMKHFTSNTQLLNRHKSIVQILSLSRETGDSLNN